MRIFLVRSAAFMLCVTLTTPVIVQAETIDVGTFNAEFLTLNKVHIKFGLPFRLDLTEHPEWEPPLFRSQRFDEAVDVVAPVVAGIDSEILVLTEVGDGTDLTALVDAVRTAGTDYPHVEVCDCSDSFTGQHVAILSKRPFVASETLLALPGRESYVLERDDPDEQLDTGVSKGMRVAVEVEASDGSTELLYVFGLHLASERGGHEQDEQRIAQASIVRRLSVPLLNDGHHVVVAGDLNDRRGQPTLHRIRGLDDIWPDLIQTGHYGFFAQGEEASRWTYAFRGELNQIDHVLVSFSLRRGSNISTRVLDVPERDDPSISDHRPIIVTVEIP